MSKNFSNKYFSKYQTEEEYNNNKDTHTPPHVSYIVNSITQLIYKSYINQYFTIVALEDDLTVSLSENACEYRIDNGEWITLNADTATPSIKSGQKILFKITNPRIPYGIGTFTVNKAFNVEGNIMSLLYGDNFEEQKDLSEKDFVFYYLFGNCTTLQNAKNLILPATTLAAECYYDMFYECISLTTTPELPATELAVGCYSGMFHGCTNLTVAPELPATTLAEGCYNSMFYDCISLTTEPELSVTTLTERCYSYMFYNCISLTTAPKLPATTLTRECYYNMFYGCSKLNKITMLATDISALRCLFNWVNGVAPSGTFIKHPDMTTLESGNNFIPTGWTVEDYTQPA